ncbi:BTAD domain-containing putative transcriptional regulator [Cellulomonas sp. ATA003]|uniref:AfsR/SARP family transcriptional regulator n=1 Tax=Cellulomonas sp. ATA003 TaxID=3073064 RepID=UPI0028736C36|nr:BTAD domain-containing putative transcriptional regulator [Cellulomonas sp. ATA003]WNB85384.1 BTAD domain-containing putative transcriptional regulator [Cellulomonas sp. ATA003]
MSVLTAHDEGVQVEATAAGRPGTVTVTLLGSFAVHGAGTVIGPRGLGGGKPRQIFEILALNPGRVVPKNHLVEMLWPDRPPANAPAALESYVSVLRQHLLAVCDSRSAIVRTSVGGYVIPRGVLDVDVERFADLAARARELGPRDAYPLLQRALDLADAPFLPEEAAAPWADDARRVHTEQVTAVLVAAADAASSLGHTDPALQLAGRALAADPHDESAWAARLTTLERAGRHVDALRVYGECRAVFAAELGCAPGPGLQAVLRRVLGGMADSDEELADLLVAIVRLRDYAEGDPPATVAARNPGRRDARISTPVREAYGLLEDLLERTRRFPVTEVRLASNG